MVGQDRFGNVIERTKQVRERSILRRIKPCFGTLTCNEGDPCPFCGKPCQEESTRLMAHGKLLKKVQELER